MNTQNQSIPNLYQIQEMYYFRTRIPLDLRLWFNGQEDFKRSLKTKSLKQAKRLLRVWNYRTEETFTLMRCGMLTDDQIKKLADNYKHKTLSELEQDRKEGCRMVVPSNPDSLDEQLEMLSEQEVDYREALAFNDLKGVSRITDTLIEENGLGEVSKNEYVALARELLKKSIEILQIEQRRAVGDYQNGYDDKVPDKIEPSSPPSLLTPVAPSLRLSVAIEKFMEDQFRKDSAKSLSLQGYAGMCQMFLRIVGDMPVQNISRDILRGYLDTLKKLPPNVNKLAKFRGKTLEEILKLNEGGKTIAIDTISNSITVIKTLFLWMFNEELITKNHSDVLVAPKKEVRPDEERSVFTIDDLKKLAEGLKAEKVRGKLEGHPERYFIPLIGLYSGMRLNEISQLHIDDVAEEQGIWVFKVQTDDEGKKQVKSASSLRVIPIHKTLIEYGFIDYVKAAKEAGQPRLWMKLKLDTKGKYHKNFSNWFLKSSQGEGFLRIHVTTDNKKNFHSFRHTFVNTLKQSDVEEVKIAELVGHANASMTTGRYGKRYEIAKMKETIDSLKYEGVSFMSL